MAAPVISAPHSASMTDKYQRRLSTVRRYLTIGAVVAVVVIGFAWKLIGR